MRGALERPDVRGVDVGIIPAYAGSTRFDTGAHTTGGDHPRVCWEHMAESGYANAREGSSPRMRGAPVRVAKSFICFVIIPAYAGSTFDLVSNIFKPRDHPRVCGEHEG